MVRGNDYRREGTRASIVFLMMALFAASGAGIVNSAAVQGRPTPTSNVTDSAVAVVTKLEDTDDGRCDADDCSLREAVGSLTNGGIVTFADGVEGVIELEDMIHITNSIMVKGKFPKSDIITLRAKHSHLHFKVEPKANLVLNSLTLAGSNEFLVSGGVIVDGANLTVINLNFTNNSNSAITNVQGNIEIYNSTFYKNSSAQGSAVINYSGTVDVKNSTFFENVGTIGGAITNFGGLAIEYSTFAGNTANRADNIDNHGELAISNSILLGRSRANGGFTNCEGRDLVDKGNNIQFPHGECSTTIPVRDPLLSAELADNGGATMTLALMDGSPAIDAGDPKVCTEQLGLVDQRGMPRKAGKCDIGAYEKQ